MKQTAKDIVKQLYKNGDGFSTRKIIAIKNAIPSTPAGIMHWVKEKKVDHNIKLCGVCRALNEKS